MEAMELADLIRVTILNSVMRNELRTMYRSPLVGFLAAHDPRFASLSRWTGARHWQPQDLLPGARGVVSFFLPFAPQVVNANARAPERVARQWAQATQDTNILIGQINTRLIEVLRGYGIAAAGETATGNFNEKTLRSHWSYKSLAVLAGLGSFGLHQLVITDAGCAGRFGSLVIAADLPVEPVEHQERCEYYTTGGCLDCVSACPVGALDPEQPLQRQLCWEQCLKNAAGFLDLGPDCQVCGKCVVVGPCALRPV